ncbi:MAG: gliding motility-associated C-terminal domain-containing protein [Bacteroidota bacterium]|nr:gliding motility-associated C-terminal domain-containing protein [Bacteroidota bacterium]
MKQNLLRLLILFAVFLVGAREARACHGVTLVGFSATTNGSSVTVNGSSDGATCGCGPYYMEVELACFSTANFTGNAPACTAATWNTYPWYRSLLNVPNYTAAAGWPDNCVVEPYSPVTIQFTDLCGGTQYVLRARERVCGSGSGGPWSAVYTFTTPGTPPNFFLTATATPPSICVGQQSTLNAVINGNGGCGTGNPIFTWNPGNLSGQTVIVSPAVTTVYTVTVTGGFVACYPVPPVTVTVTVVPPPTAGTASVSPPTVCQGGCVTLTLTGSNGSIQWQSSPNGITWTNIAGATTTPYQYCPVNAAMFFHAVVSGSPGCGSATSNTVSVGITPVPTLTINPSAPSICIGQSVTLTVSGSSGYTWTGPNSYTATGPSITISPTVTGTYSVSTSGLCPATRTVVVTVNPLPVIVFTPPNPSICSGSSVTIDAGSSANTYTWVPVTGITYLSASQDSVSAAPLTTTTYNVTSVSPAGCTASSNVTVTVNTIPALILSDTAITVCPNTTDTVSISGANTYTWNTMTGVTFIQPDGSQVEFNPPASATYTVTGTSSAGCVDSATVNVTVANNIVVDAGLPDSICPGTSIGLTATGGTNYSWTSTPFAMIVNGNTATPTVTPTVTTIFTVNVSNQFGCTGLDSVTIIVRSLPSASAGSDTAICVGASTDLTGNGNGNYSWTGSNITNGSATSTPTVAPTGTSDYILTMTDAFGCVNTDTVNVLVHNLPAAGAGADQTICGNNCASLLASGGTQYSWLPSANLSSPNTAATQACPAASLTYTVTVTDAFGCVNTDSLDITVAPALTVVASPNASICPGNSTPVSATPGGGNSGPYSYAWAPAAGLASTTSQNTTATPATTTTYTVTVTDNCGSIAVIDSVTVTVFPSPVINATPSVTSGCSPVCVDFTGISNPAAASCTYDFGDQTTSNLCMASHCYATAGSYTVIYTVTDVNGCPSTITYPNMITVHPNPVAGFTLTPQTTSILNPVIGVTPICTSCDTTTYTMGDTLSSTITNNVTPFNFAYTWPGTYIIWQYAVNQYGCRDSVSDFVVIEPDWSFFAPNAFTPNEDTHNDIFFVFGEGIDNSTFQLIIYDRWGKQIFVSDDMNKGWNGKVNGGSDLAQIDTYVWSCHFKDNKGDPHKFVGHVSLIR